MRPWQIEMPVLRGIDRLFDRDGKCLDPVERENGEIIDTLDGTDTIECSVVERGIVVFEEPGNVTVKLVF